VKRTPEAAVEAGDAPVGRPARFYTVIKAVFRENGLRGSAYWPINKGGTASLSSFKGREVSFLRRYE